MKFYIAAFGDRLTTPDTELAEILYNAKHMDYVDVIEIEIDLTKRTKMKTFGHSDFQNKRGE